MKACESCHVNVQTDGEFCPLCGMLLVPAAPAPPKAAPLPRNRYPDLSGATAQYNFLVRLALFFSLLGGGLCVLINLLAAPGFLWCLIVVAALLYLWLSVPLLLRRGGNYAKRVTFHMALTSLLTVALDIIVGYTGWSVSYVVPALLDGAIFAVGLVVVLDRASWNRYIFYQMLAGVFGFVPLVLYLAGVAQSLVMVLVTAGLGLASILVGLVFGGRWLKSDLKRRFHL